MDTPWGNTDDITDLGLGVKGFWTRAFDGLYLENPAVLPSKVTAIFSHGPNWAQDGGNGTEAMIVLAIL